MFSKDTQWHLVHPWHRDAVKPAMREGPRRWFPRCTARLCPAAAAAGSEMELSEVQSGLTAEVRESALLGWGEHDLVPLGISFLQEGSLGRHLLILLLLPLAELHRVLWGVAG